jgi:predicted DNA-binding transcriptional regulator AlpA
MTSTTLTGYFRPSDAKNAVGISRPTLYRLKQKGLIKTRKVGNMAFFSVAEVKSVIENMGDQMGDQDTES